MEKSPEEKLKQEKASKTARTLWMVLTPIFAVLLLFNLYRWTQGKDTLSSILSQSGVMLIGLATLIGSRNKPLSYVFLILGGIAALVGVVMAIMRFLD